MLTRCKKALTWGSFHPQSQKRAGLISLSRAKLYNLGAFWSAVSLCRQMCCMSKFQIFRFFSIRMQYENSKWKYLILFNNNCSGTFAAVCGKTASSILPAGNLLTHDASLLGPYQGRKAHIQLSVLRVKLKADHRSEITLKNWNKAVSSAVG